MRIGLVPLGLSNLGSITASFRRLGHAVSVWETLADASAVDWVVLPGVGAMPSAQAGLNQPGLSGLLADRWHRREPMLGICLGMQLWFGPSDEGGTGLGWLPGRIARICAPILPHIGWNELAISPAAPAWLQAYQNAAVYFVHGYAVEAAPSQMVMAQTRYGASSFPSVIMEGPLVGVQFHPELSGDIGQSLLEDILQHGGTRRDY